jgi:MreB/Mrl family cell shape determining protein
MLSKLEELKFLNEGTNLSALKSIDNVLDRKMKTLNPEYVASIISTIVPEAEDIKLKLGSAYPYEGEAAMEIKGRNLIDGLPKSVEITSEQVRQALADPVDEILDSIRYTLDRTPPELAADIIERGITLTGGGALLRGLDKLIATETGMPVKIAENPLDCVVNGTGICLEKDLLGFNR